MKISTAKTEVFYLSRNPDQCSLQVNGATLKQAETFKYLGVAFMDGSAGRQDEELDTRSVNASAVMQALHYSIVMNNTSFFNKVNFLVVSLNDVFFCKNSGYKE